MPFFGLFISRNRCPVDLYLCFLSHFFLEPCPPGHPDLDPCGTDGSDGHYPIEIYYKEEATLRGLQIFFSHALEPVLISFPSRLQGVFNRHHCGNEVSRHIPLSDLYGGDHRFQSIVPVKTLSFRCFGGYPAGNGRRMGIAASCLISGQRLENL